jgi:hypothetical protein
MKRQSLTPALFVIVLATGGLPAAAQSTNTNNAAAVEVTSYVSLGSYPSPRVGAAVAFRLTPTLSVESEVGYRHDMASRLSPTASLLYDLVQRSWERRRRTLRLYNGVTFPTGRR